jgi:hypothetical protein
VTASREDFTKVVSLLEANFPTQPNSKLEKVSKLIWGASLPRPGDAPDSEWAPIPLNSFLENNFGRPTLYQRDGLYGGDSKYADPDFVPKTKRVPITLTAHWREKAWDETKEQRQKEIDATEKEFVEAVAASFGGPINVSEEAPKKVSEDHEMTEESGEVPEDGEMTAASEEVQGEHDMTDAPMEAPPLFPTFTTHHQPMEALLLLLCRLSVSLQPNRRRLNMR